MKLRTSLWHLFLGLACLALTFTGVLHAQAPPTDETEVRDLSVPPVRELGARISMPLPGWDPKERKATGPAVRIQFSGPAAPLDAVGEKVRPGLIRMNPEVQGEWWWHGAERLEFKPAAGWLPPGSYRFQVRDGLLTDDCKLAAKTDFMHARKAPKLTAQFRDRNYYIDPKTPKLQQLVTTVSFSHPVDIEELREHFSVTTVTGIEIFQAGSEAEVIADESDPRRFHLRSPLMKPGDKEDLILFRIREGMKPTVGGDGNDKPFESKLTAYSRDSHFFVESVGSMLRKTPEGEPEQALLLEWSIPAWTGPLAKMVEAWKLPPEERDERGRWVYWTKDTVTDEVLKKAEKLKLEHIVMPDAPPMEQAMAFRVAQQPGGKVFIRVAKGTEGPGGFVTPEDYGEVTTLQFIPRETEFLGNGGLLALNGERKVNVRSRGLDHLRYTVARVQTDRINHLVSQTRGNFESPYFRNGFGFEDISNYEQSVQAIVKEDSYSQNYSSFDFAPLVDAGRAGEKPTHGLFYVTVEGVRQRTDADAEVPETSPDHMWMPLSARHVRHYGYRPQSNSELSYPIGDRMRDGRFVLVTDLGLIMKESADGTRSVFVQSFSKRGPVAQVQVSVLARNGNVLAKASTDATGKAELDSLRGLEREQEPVALVARKGQDLAFIPWAKSDRRLEKSRFDVWGVNYSEATALTAALFTERGIYRPGESIHVGGIVRQRDWLGDLNGMPVELVVLNAKRDTVGRYPLKLGEHGVISLTVPTVDSAPTGPWQIYLERPRPEDESRQRGALYLGETIVRVEEFQPDRLKIKAAFEPEVSQGWVSPDALAVSVQLDTLFGMAAANRRIASSLHLSPATPYFSNWQGWSFGLPSRERFASRELPLSDETTDENGQARIALNMEAHTAPMLRARIEIEGFEADGGRGVKTERSTLVSRQAYMIGYKAERSLSYLDPRDPVPVEVVAIGPDTKPVKAPGLIRVLIQTKHSSVLTKQGNGNLAYESRSRDEVLESVPVNLLAKPQALKLPLGTPGKFRYEFRNAAGEALCSIPFFVAGKGDSEKDLERSGELEIQIADKRWLPGEELEFSLTTPFTGAGLITIERDSVIKHQWFQCNTKASVQKIRLPDSIEGGVYLSVVMARALDSPDVFLNPLAAGIVPVPAARGEREMQVTLDAPDRVRPGERVAIGFQAPKEGQVAIWAVDEGIHLVSSYQAPDPLDRLLPGAGLEVETYQLMDVLMPEFSLLRKALAIGGDGGPESEIPQLKMGLNPFKRERDAPVVYWSGFVPCGPERKEVFYEVPDYFAGRLKIMAVAVSSDSLGVGQAESIVKGDFVLQATTPLFVVPGDEFTASVTVANQLEGEAVTDQVKVGIESQGGVEILEAPPESQSIPVGKEKTLSYRCRATAQLGNGELKFIASSGGSRQVTRGTFSVRPGVARAARVQSGWFRNGSHDVAADHAMFTDLAERRAVVSTTPLGLAHGLSAFLKEYPHGCTEQITSRGFPWLVLKDDANFGVDREEAEKAVTNTINQLSRRQGSNGGFGYWSAYSPEGFDYVTVYVGHFLTECKAAGFHVPARLHQSTMRRLRYMADANVSKPYLSGGETRYWRTRWEAEMRASAIYLLTRNEEVTTNYALKLQDFMEAEVPAGLWHRDSTAVWLAATWRLLKKESAAQPLLKAHRAALKAEPPDNWRHGSYYYHSALTREATAFTVLCRHFPEVASKLGYDDLKPLTAMIESADFHTLSAAWSIMALKAYADLSEGQGVKAGIASVDGDKANVLAEPAVGQLQVEVPEGMVRFFFAPDAPTGLGAWYQVIEKGFAKKLPEEASGTHIEVVRELIDAEGRPVTQGKLGETIFANLTVRNLTKTELPNLALTEMLPGSFELAPPGEAHSLRPGLATRQGVDYIDVREDRALIYLGLKPGASLTLKYALRPTCAGSFVVPPPYAEDMYEAKVRANGAAGRLMVFSRN